MPDYQGTLYAPEFPAGLEWLNTARPLTLKELRGKVVLLDFWTYCCINCMHILPDLKRLEKKYAKELVVIGVHSAKFFTEREKANIRQAILRYEIEHPVINDREMLVWELYSSRAWPTLFLIDPAGKIVASHSGEGVYELFDKAIARVIETFDRKGQLDRRPLRFRLERHRLPASLLSFPGKVLADEASQRLFIADSNHHRLVVVSLKTNRVQTVIGSGLPGMRDGNFEEARFQHLQGMALRGEQLYVADTGNHAIRLVNLEKRTVTTLAGTGQQSRRYPPAAGAGKTTPLNSPWDLVLHKETLFIAMAGSHQLWKLDLRTGEVSPHAGTGREARIDGPLRLAALAQPSGITTDGYRLYFADSESSCIRAADIDPEGRVETLTGGDLFDFGDRDGKGWQARLQHPLGIVYHQGMLYIADTYNNKIKRFSIRTQTLETFLGTGQEGWSDGEGRKATLDEPGGVSIADGRLYIADTNNHLIRVASLQTARVTTLQIEEMEKLRTSRMAKFRSEMRRLPPQTVKPGPGRLTLSLQLPNGYKLNPQASSAMRIIAGDKRILRFNKRGEKTVAKPHFPLTLPFQATEGETHLQIELQLYYCKTRQEALCYFKEIRLQLPLRVTSEAEAHQIRVSYRLSVP